MAAASSLALLLAGIAVAGSGCLTVEAELPEVEITQLLTGRYRRAGQPPRRL